jgi:hypothetical protein
MDLYFFLKKNLICLARISLAICIVSLEDPRSYRRGKGYIYVLSFSFPNVCGRKEKS